MSQLHTLTITGSPCGPSTYRHCTLDTIRRFLDLEGTPTDTIQPTGQVVRGTRTYSWQPQ